MASLLLDALRGLLLGEATDYAKDKAKPVVNQILRQMQPEQEAITPGARMIDGYPSMSSGLPAQTSGYKQQIPGVTAGAADPRVLQSMYDEIAADQTMREQEVDADWAAENKQNVLDAVRRAGGDVVQERTYPTTTSGESATTQSYTPSGDDSAMFQQKSQDLMQEAQKLKQEAPDATPDQVTAAALVERGRKDSKFFDVMGDKISETFGDEQTWLSLAMAFNTLRFQPDQGLQKALGSRIETLQAAKKANATAKWLRSKGTANAITAAEYLEAGGKLKDAMELFKGTDYGLTPIKIMDEDGNIKLIQLNKNGQTREVELPEGFTAAPDIQKVDTGTGTVILDKHGNQIGFVKKDVAGVESEKERGKYTQEQINAAPQSYQNAKSKLKVIQDFLDHPSFNDVFGAVQGRLPSVRQGTLDAEAYLDQIKGAAFLAAFESLKGGGQISNVEGMKAEQAMARLRTAQSEKEAKKALNELADILRVAMAKARQMAPDKITQLESYYPQEQASQDTPAAKPQITPEQAAEELARRRGQ